MLQRLQKRATTGGKPRRTQLEKVRKQYSEERLAWEKSHNARKKKIYI